MRSLLMTWALLGAPVGCRQAAAPPADLPAGLWDAHTHLTYWGEDALDSLDKYGIVGVRDLGGDPALLNRWRDEIAAGTRRGPRILLAGPASEPRGGVALAGGRGRVGRGGLGRRAHRAHRRVDPGEPDV